MSREERIDVTPLADSYEIIAELGADEATRSYIGKRRADGLDVVITVARTPAGDERNALTHLAADVKLLSTLEHRHLVRVLEGRWLGAGALAIVRQRIFAPTVEELLSRGERFSNARVAAILREVNGILDWARRERVVHRAVTTDTVFLEPGTDRVLVAFALRPIPLTGAPEAEGDAQTVATIARAMLARSAEGAEDDERPEERLAELRPDLPQRVIERTDMLLHPTRGGAAPDIAGYLALIAMADAVKVGEDESARVTQEALTEQRLTREQLTAERAQQEQEFAQARQQLADERARLEREIADQREALSAERTELERSVAEERARLSRDRAELTGAITAAHEQLALERQQLERQRLAMLGTAGAQGASAPARGKAGAERALAPVLVPAADAPPAVELPAARGLQSEEAERSIERETMPLGAGIPAPGDEEPRPGHAAWAVPAGAVTLLGIVVASALALSRGPDQPTLVPLAGDGATVVDSAAQLRATRDSAQLVVDSAGGAVMPAPAATAAATVPAGASTGATPVDSAAADSAHADSGVAVAATHHTTPKHRQPRAEKPAVRDSAAMADSAAANPFFLPPVQRTPRTASPDTTARPDTSIRRDSMRERGSGSGSGIAVRTPSARADSGARRDSVVRTRPDTMPPA